MKVAASPSFVQPLVAINKTASAQQASTAVAEPKDSVTTTPPSQKPESGAGQIVKMGVTGLASLAAGIPATYAGVIGGGIIGSLFGAGAGTAIAAVSSHGAVNFVTSAFHTTSVAAEIGITVGGLSGLIGGITVGVNAGKAAGRVFGLSGEPTRAADLKETKGLVAHLLAGIGGMGGATGGAIIGAGIAAAGSIGHGVLAQGVAQALTNAPMAAAIGGATGAVLFGLVGGKGGVTLAKLTDKSITGIENTYNHILGKTGDGETLEQKNFRLQALQGDLKSKQTDLAQKADGNRKDYNDDKSKIDARESGVVAQETDVKNREGQIDTKIESEGQAKFTANSQDLRDWKTRLDTRETQQNAQQANTVAREAQEDKEIHDESHKIFDQRRVPLEAHYNDLSHEQDVKDQDMNSYEGRIHQETETQYQQVLAPQESDLRNQISDAQTQESYASQRRSQAQSEASAAAGQRSQAEGQLNAARQDHGSAQSEVDSINNATNNLRQQLSELQGERSQLDAKEREIQQRENAAH